MQRVVLRDVDLASFRDVVGPAGCADGTEAVRRGAVVQMAWEASQQLLTGTVRDGGGDLRTVSASFRASTSFPLRYRAGHCSCAVGLNCAHVAALVIAATDETLQPERESGAPAARRSTLPWEQSLDSLLGTPRPAGTADDADAGPADTGAPLAIELSLVPNTPEPATRYAAYYTRQEPDDGTSRLRLQARLVTRGRSGAWVAGNLTWSRLDYLLLRDEYPAAHVRLLHELYALCRASATARSSYYGYGYAYGGDQRYLELSGCESRQLWPVLEQAHAAALPLVYPRRQGLVPPPGTAELCLDVTSDVTDEGTALLIAPVIKTPGGDDAVPLSFIGTEGHGVVLADRVQARQSRQPEHARFRLARLAAPVPRQLQQLALADERLVVPPAGQAAFLSRYYPRLRRMAPVISSDGSFTPPRISEPRLVLSARYFGAHDVDLRWEWAYQVGDAELRAAVGSRAAEFRDPAAEARVLAGVDLDLPERARFSAATLHGLDTMVFSTEVLPLLSGRDDVRVEVSGRVPDYREAGDSLRIGVSAADLDGEQDWFDLGITVTVEGREVPFAELFVALASGQSHLLLPDGAYFSLDKPELMALARLIEEARALTDQPAALDGPLRISRFQAGLWDELAGLGVVRHQAAAWQRQVQGLLNLLRGRRAPRTPRAFCRAPGAACGAGLAAAPVSALRVPVARVPVAARARRHPRRRHGAGQDAADAGAAFSCESHEGRGVRRGRYG